MKNLRSFRIIVILFLCDLPNVFCEAIPSNPKWEKAIRTFEAQDRLTPPRLGGTLFIGSSSIRRWKHLETDFKGDFKGILNRGFGGSQIVDSIFYANRIILPYAPKKIFLYAGDNDIAAGKTAEIVFRDFKAFVKRIHKALPETEIVFISIKPSLSRWHLAAEMKKANQRIQRWTNTLARLGYVDIWSPMLDANGKPNPDLFVEDGLHLNRKGYEIWRQSIRARMSFLF